MFSAFIYILACSTVPVPDLVMPPATLLLRESFQGPGPERTGNWWGRFDRDGCWWEAHNTWLVVSDPSLVDSSSWFLHWNAQEEQQPWFCLNETQKTSLIELTKTAESMGAETPYVGAVDRWSFWTPDGVVSQVIPRGSMRQTGAPVTALFARFSSDGVWGQSPELKFVDVADNQHP